MFRQDSSSASTISAGPVARTDTILTGIGLVLAATISFSISDALAKSLSAELPALEIAWLRWCGFVMLVVPSLVTSGGRVLRSRAPGLQLVRSVGVTGSAVFFITGLGYLPIATATATSFVAPLFTTALSIVFLGERVGIRRWAAVVVGLVGVMIVVRPGGHGFTWASALPLVSAACWAMALIATRKSRGADGPATAMSIAALVGFVILSVMVPFVWVTPRLDHLGTAAAMALFSTGGQFLTVLAFYRAPASILAPFSYTQLIWAGALGFTIFGTLPDLWTWIGAAIIVGSGIYTAHRERVRLAEARQTAATPVPTLGRS